MQSGDRVKFKSDPEWQATVRAVHGDGTVDVDGDGWSGTVADEHLLPAREDKTWPPKGIETK